MKWPVTLYLGLLYVIAQAQDISICKPFGVHVSLGDFYSFFDRLCPTKETYACSSWTKAVIVFQTERSCEDAFIRITSPNGESNDIQAKDTGLFEYNYRDGSKAVYKTYYHEFHLSSQIQFDQVYTLVASGDKHFEETTDKFQLKLPTPFVSSEQNSKKSSLSFLVFGNWNPRHQNGQLLTTHLKNRIGKPDSWDFVACLGNLGYDLQDEGGRRGDEFMRAIEPIATSWPLQITPGQRDEFLGYEFLNFRFRMPDYAKSKNHYYSINIGHVHLVFLNMHNFAASTSETQETILDWLRKDLEIANLQKNLAERPWIVLLSQEAIYSSLDGTSYSYNKLKVIEQLLINYGVALVLSAKGSLYERTNPVYLKKVPEDVDTTEPGEVVDCKYPIHINDGTPIRADNDIKPPKSPWSAVIDYTPGYSRVTVIHKGILGVEHIDVATGKTIDSVRLVKSDIAGENYIPKPKNRWNVYLMWAGGFLVIIILILLARKLWLRRRKVEFYEEHLATSHNSVELK